MVQKSLNQILMKQPIFMATLFVVVALSLKSSFGVQHSSPTAGIAVTPLSVPMEMGELVGYSGTRYGFSGFVAPADSNTPPNVYLNYTSEELVDPYGKETESVDKITGVGTWYYEWTENGVTKATNGTVSVVGFYPNYHNSGDLGVA